MHFGSLVAGVASYLDARAHGGEWLVRIEDVDETRAIAGADTAILNTLEKLRMHWDLEVCYQSRRKARYREVIDQLLVRDVVFPCGCSRAEIAREGRPGSEGPVYPGTCRNGLPAGVRPKTLRIRTDTRSIAFDDRIAGRHNQNIGHAVGDFVIRRADGFTAYQLAVVVDDHDQGITHVVRGADLLTSTPRQIFLQRTLGYATPRYAHIPIALNTAGKKISKRDQARPIELSSPLHALLAAMKFLNQDIPDPEPATLAEFWEHAIAMWDIDKVNTEDVIIDAL